GPGARQQRGLRTRQLLGVDTGPRIGQQRTVLRPDPHRYVMDAGETGRGVYVVGVAVGGEDGGGCQRVLAQRPVEWFRGALTGVDDHAPGTAPWGEHVTVGLERPGRKACDQHVLTST